MKSNPKTQAVIPTLTEYLSFLLTGAFMECSDTGAAAMPGWWLYAVSEVLRRGT
jgi:hypothetical protein